MESIAVAYYQKHLARLKRYNEKNKEKLAEKARERFQQIKADDDKYEEYKEQKRQKYRESNPPIVLPYKEF